ncbi:MAG TPA: NUDIX hydrolase [Candidatus Saccharimonadales bacterium]|nr:NUDIX hydrolase [Candidatus Saccharimonadales bacterium]
MRTVRLAGCVIADEKGRILLIHRNTELFQHWELPGGKIEANEREEQAAIRELREELAVDVGIVRRLGGDMFTDKTGDYRYVWFLAKILSGEPRVGEPDKFDYWRFFAVEELPDLNLSANMKKFLPKLQRKEIVLTP